MFDIPQSVLILIPSIIFSFAIFGWLLKDRNSVMRADIAEASGFKYTKVLMFYRVIPTLKHSLA
jgi:hypothetical protein